MAGGNKRRSGVTSTARPTADHGGMVLRSFDDVRVWMDTRRMVALSDAVVASTAGLVRLVCQYLHWRWINALRWRRPMRVRQNGV